MSDRDESELPWIWLEGNEAEATLKCGCVLTRDRDGSGDPSFDACAMHLAAPEILEALQNIEANLTGNDCPAERVADSLVRTRTAIAKAELTKGQENGKDESSEGLD